MSIATGARFFGWRTLQRNATYFCGARALSPRGSQPRSSGFVELPRSRARCPAQAEGLPHKTLFEYEKVSGIALSACSGELQFAEMPSTFSLAPSRDRPREEEDPFRLLLEQRIDDFAADLKGVDLVSSLQMLLAKCGDAFFGSIHRT